MIRYKQRYKNIEKIKEKRMKPKKKFTYVTRYLGISAVLLSYPAIAHAEDIDPQPVAIEEEKLEEVNEIVSQEESKKKV